MVSYQSRLFCGVDRHGDGDCGRDGDRDGGESFTRKQGRAFHRMLSGCRVADRQGKTLRFLTLTSSNDSPSLFVYDGDGDMVMAGVNRPKLNPNFTKHFKSLKQCLRNTSIADLHRDGYLTFNDIRKYYRGKGVSEGLKFEYFKVIVSEGSGVIHVLVKGDYIPQGFLSDWWSDVHNAKVVDIRRCWDNNKRVAGYMAGQYIANQEALYTSHSWSGGWLPRGAIGYWKWLMKWSDAVPCKQTGYADVWSFGTALKRWHQYLDCQVKERQAFTQMHLVVE